MGADIHGFLEVKRDGKWERYSGGIFPGGSNMPFDWRSYGIFGFLADVRNYSHIPPLGEPKGLPDDSEYLNAAIDKPMRYSYGYIDNGTAYTVADTFMFDIDYHSHTYYTLRELISFDYNNVFEDRRKIVLRLQDGDVGYDKTLEVEQGGGEWVSYKEFFGEDFFKCIEIMETLGGPDDVRVVIWFDN